MRELIVLVSSSAPGPPLFAFLLADYILRFHDTTGLSKGCLVHATRLRRRVLPARSWRIAILILLLNDYRRIGILASWKNLGRRLHGGRTFWNHLVFLERQTWEPWGALLYGVLFWE